MWMPSLLFLLPLLGVAAAQHYNNTGPSHSHGFNGPAIKDPVWMMAETFSERLVEAVRSRNSTAISNLFDPESLYSGCKGTYDKNGMTTMLLKLPSPARFTFTLRSVHDLGKKINFAVSIIGFESRTVLAEFVLLKTEQRLESGKINNC